VTGLTWARRYEVKMKCFILWRWSEITMPQRKCWCSHVCQILTRHPIACLRLTEAQVHEFTCPVCVCVRLRAACLLHLQLCTTAHTTQAHAALAKTWHVN
jgi:hypothetical protein